MPARPQGLLPDIQGVLVEDRRQLGVSWDAEELVTAPLAALNWFKRHRHRPMALVHPAIAPFLADLGSGPGDCVLLGDAREQPDKGDPRFRREGRKISLQRPAGLPQYQ